ncbi:MAG: peptidoglycan editing factor PgeF [Nitrospirae bacterium]|nr:MAG: peptidoglycan editing factor PgeF [Nitrospirota bacterium]
MIIPPLFPENVISGFTEATDPPVEELLRKQGIQRIYFPKQEHTDRIIIVNTSDGRTVADGVITKEKGLALAVKVADCLPVLIYDPETETIASVHAGWRGTSKAILAKAISLMKKLGSNPEDMKVAFGPSIKGCCYTVGPEVVEALKRLTPSDDFVLTDGGALKVDLLKANLLQTEQQGILRENIWFSQDCTCCSKDRYYSYRRDRTKNRQFGFIALR